MTEASPAASVVQPVEPVDTSQRIASIDVVRGVALLGILVMNIQSFSMPDAAYLNPAAYGDLTGLNRWVWIVSQLLTLYTTPVVYLYLDRFRLWSKRVFARRRAAEAL